jgi:hypothetical protein
MNMVCETSTLDVLVESGTGGNGTDHCEFRTHNGQNWSNWQPYIPGSGIVAMGYTSVEVRLQRLSTFCAPSTYRVVSWDIEKQATSGIIIKTPNQMVVCKGVEVSAELLPGTGGNGVDISIYRVLTSVWSEWQGYSSNEPIPTGTEVNQVEVATLRYSTSCTIAALNIASWQVEQPPAVSAGPDRSLCPGNVLEIVGSSAVNASDLLWTTSGDGSFDNPTALHPIYTPGSEDWNNISVTLTLTSNIGGQCQDHNAMELSMLTTQTSSVEVVTNKYNVCYGETVSYLAIAANQGAQPYYNWKVNGTPAGTNNAHFDFAPLMGDQVWVELIPDHDCPAQQVVVSNIVTVEVTLPQVSVTTSPAIAGTASYTGDIKIGQPLSFTAAPAPGWDFSHWTTVQGVFLHQSADFVLTLQECNLHAVAHFVSKTTLQGQLRYYNPLESPMSDERIDARFFVQLFKDGQAVSSSQLVDEEAKYEFHALEGGTGYQLKLWEQPLTNQLTDTWMWNNWGGVTAVDALIINFMSVNNPLVSSFPWLLPDPIGDFTAAFKKVADLNNSNDITALDALITSYRTVGNPSVIPFPVGRHNFVLSAHMPANVADKIYPFAPELLFSETDNYIATTPASEVIYTLDISQITIGNNPLNIYFVAAADLNASYVPGPAMKQAPIMDYQGMLSVNVGQEVDIPIYADQHMELGALTMGISYDLQQIEVREIAGAQVSWIDPSTGTVRIAWNDPVGKTINTTTPLVVLKARLLKAIEADQRYMELLAETELAGTDAMELPNVKLHSISLQTPSASSLKLDLTHKVIPNPFREKANLEYNLPVAGKVEVNVYNQYGQLIKQLVNERQQAGTHQVEVTDADLNSMGTYYYKILLEGETQSFVGQSTLIVIN